MAQMYVSATPNTAMGLRKHCGKLHCHNGVVYMFGHGALEKGWVPVSLIWHPLMYVCTLNFSPGFRVGVSLTLTPSFYFVVLHFFTDYYFLLSLLYFLSAMPPPKLKLQHIYSLCIFSIQHYFDHKQFSKNHMCFVIGVEIYKVFI